MSHLADFNIVEMLVPVNKWTRPGSVFTKRGIVVHWTGNINRGANARANRNFIHTLSVNNPGKNTPSEADDVYASANYFLDEEEVVVVVPPHEKSHSAGAKSGYTGRFAPNTNNVLIAVEICVNMDSDWVNTYDHAVRFVAALCLEEGFLDPWAALIRHHDISGKDCPLMMTDLVWNESHVRGSVRDQLKYKYKNNVPEEALEEGYQWIMNMAIDGCLGTDLWNRFISDVAAAMNGVYVSPLEPAPQPIPEPEVIPETVENKVVKLMSRYFKDLAKDHWAANTLDAAHELKTPDGEALFGGRKDENGNLLAAADSPITRAEATVLMLRAIKIAVAEAKK